MQADAEVSRRQQPRVVFNGEPGCGDCHALKGQLGDFLGGGMVGKGWMGVCERRARAPAAGEAGAYPLVKALERPLAGDDADEVWQGFIFRCIVACNGDEDEHGRGWRLWRVLPAVGLATAPGPDAP